MNKQKAQLIALYAVIYAQSAFIAVFATKMIQSGAGMRTPSSMDIMLVVTAVVAAAVLGPMSMLIREDTNTLTESAFTGIGVALVVYVLTMITIFIIDMKDGSTLGALFVSTLATLIGLFYAAIPIVVLGALAGVVAEHAHRWLLAQD